MNGSFEVEFRSDRSSHPLHLSTDSFSHAEQPTGVLRPKSTKRGSILLIDDDEDQLDLFGVLLGRLNYPIVSATSAQEALNIAQTTLLEIVVSDIRMPQMSGYELLTKLRMDPRMANLPVILMTSSTELHNEEARFVTADVDLFCLKSNFQLLMSQVDFLLG